MTKNHLKRLTVPRTWQIEKKKNKWITRPRPGPHSLAYSMPLNVIMRDVLGYAKTATEVKSILQTKQVLVDGKRRKDSDFPVGLMDVVSFLDIKKHFRCLLNTKGKFIFVPIDENESRIKPCKIITKVLFKGKTQLNLFDGKNMLVDKDVYKTSDTVIVNLQTKKIEDHIKFEKGALIYLHGGSNVGRIGVIEEIKDNNLRFKAKSGTYDALKRFAFVIGKDKPVIAVGE